MRDLIELSSSGSSQLIEKVNNNIGEEPDYYYFFLSTCSAVCSQHNQVSGVVSCSLEWLAGFTALDHLWPNVFSLNLILKIKERYIKFYCFWYYVDSFRNFMTLWNICEMHVRRRRRRRRRWKKKWEYLQTEKKEHSLSNWSCWKIWNLHRCQVTKFSRDKWQWGAGVSGLPILNYSPYLISVGYFTCSIPQPCSLRLCVLQPSKGVQIETCKKR